MSAFQEENFVLGIETVQKRRDFIREFEQLRIQEGMATGAGEFARLLFPPDDTYGRAKLDESESWFAASNQRPVGSKVKKRGFFPSVDSVASKESFRTGPYHLKMAMLLCPRLDV